MDVNSTIAHTISLCDDSVLKGSLIRIQSTETDQEFLTQSSCACRIYLEANVQVELTRLQFITQPSVTTECEQKVALWRHQGDRVNICQINSINSIRKDYLLGCYDVYDQINLVYENQDPNVQAFFTVQASGKGSLSDSYNRKK